MNIPIHHSLGGKSNSQSKVAAARHGPQQPKQNITYCIHIFKLFDTRTRPCRHITHSGPNRMRSWQVNVRTSSSAVSFRAQHSSHATLQPSVFIKFYVADDECERRLIYRFPYFSGVKTVSVLFFYILFQRDFHLQGFQQAAHTHKQTHTHTCHTNILRRNAVRIFKW